MNQAQREDMAVAVIDATAPLYDRIAELEKELEVVSENEASLLTESLNVCDALGIDTSGDYNVVACVQQLRADLKEAQEQLQELASVRSGSEIAAREMAAEIEGLREDLRVRDEEIARLQQRLDELGEKYDELIDRYED